MLIKVGRLIYSHEILANLVVERLEWDAFVCITLLHVSLA